MFIAPKIQIEPRPYISIQSCLKKLISLFGRCFDPLHPDLQENCQNYDKFVQ